MSLSTKILLFLSGSVLIGALAFIIYKQMEISTRQQAIETQVVEQKTLIDGIVRSQSSWTTKDDLNQFIKDNNINLKAIQDDLDKLHAEVNAVNVTVADSLGQHGNNVPSTGTGSPNPNPPPNNTCKDGSPCPNADPYGYQSKTQLLSVSEDFGTIQVPIGSIGFSAWQPAPWSFDIKPREYNVDSVVGTDENQRLYFYNKFTVKVDDKEYDVPIKNATTKQIYPDSKFTWWNPRLLIGIDGGINVNEPSGEFTPNLNLGIMSYGKYLNQSDWSILEVGFGYGIVSKKPQVVVTPFAYNLGQLIPLIKNTYVGPSLNIGTNGQFSIMGGLRVGL